MKVVDADANADWYAIQMDCLRRSVDLVDGSCVAQPVRLYR